MRDGDPSTSTTSNCASAEPEVRGLLGHDIGPPQQDRARDVRLDERVRSADDCLVLALREHDPSRALPLRLMHDELHHLA